MKKYITLFLVFFCFVISGQSTPGVYTIKNAKVNTEYSDFGTAFFGKEKVVFASPKQGLAITRKVWDYNNQPYLDLFVGEVSDEGEIIYKQKMPGDINTSFHEGMVTFTKDMKTVYFSANMHVKRKKRKKFKGANNIQIFKATINKNGEWDNLELLPFNNLEFSSGHPALNIDDSKLYFVSDRPGSIGKTDIFLVEIYVDGTYSEPRNLGNIINTKDREMFPFISDDNILYFSSNGHPGYGELDVFASKIFETTVSEPINLGVPVNSEKDDFAYIINDDNHKGYFSSNRKGGKGDDDIYSFAASPPIHIECKQVIAGVVRDQNTNEILPGALVVLLDEQGKELEVMATDENDAKFRFVADCDTSYKIIVNLENYSDKELDLKTSNDLHLPPLKVLLDLEVSNESIIADENNAIQINSIYFDFDKYDIRYDAKLELDKISDIMKANPELEIDINSHTDSRGTHKYNMSLSNHRAKATIAYLVKKGIDNDRISGKGYGEEQLATNCPNGVSCTNFQHQLNRRSEFSLMQDGFANVMLRSNNILNSNQIDNNNFTKNSGAFVNYDFSKKTAVYTVQIGAFKGKVQTNKYSKLNNLFNHRYSDGLNRYYSGIFETSTEAKFYLKSLKKEGFEGAFVIGLEGSKRNF